VTRDDLNRTREIPQDEIEAYLNAHPEARIMLQAFRQMLRDELQKERKKADDVMHQVLTFYDSLLKAKVK